jgi:hypothetical protein
MGIRNGSNGWRKLTGVLCDKNMPVKIKGKIYRTSNVIWYGNYTTNQVTRK